MIIDDYTITLYFFVFLQSFVIAQDIQALEKELDQTIEKGEYYYNIRLDEIKSLKQNLRVGSPHCKQELFDINYKIYNHYVKFQSDSALYYIQKCQYLLSVHEDSLRTILDLDLAALYSTTGRYIEADNILGSIKKENNAKEILPKYYQTYGSFYSHYGQSNNNNEFCRLSEIYRDSLILYLDSKDPLHQIESATKKLFSENRNEAISALKKYTQRSSYVTICATEH